MTKLLLILYNLCTVSNNSISNIIVYKQAMIVFEITAIKFIQYDDDDDVIVI